MKTQQNESEPTMAIVQVQMFEKIVASLSSNINQINYLKKILRNQKKQHLQDETLLNGELDIEAIKTLQLKLKKSAKQLLKLSNEQLETVKIEFDKIKHLNNNQLHCLMKKTQNIIGILSTSVQKKKIRKIKK